MKEMGIEVDENKQEEEKKEPTINESDLIEKEKLEKLQTTRKIKNIKSLVSELHNVIIQKYADKPCLYKGKKFDLRVYMLIGCVKPYLVLYNPGYCRISLNDFTLDDFNTPEGKITHMTNNSVQKKHPEFKDRKEETIIELDTLWNYLIETNVIKDKEEFDGKVTNKIKEIMRIIFLQVKDKLDRTYGCYELLGWDFLLDENLNPSLIEININPALFTDTSTQKKVIPKVVDDMVDLTLRLHKFNHSSCPQEDFNEVSEEIKGSGANSGDAKYNFEILYQEGAESLPFV